ncbi:Carboxylesterase patB [Hyphodiscus hymeniophilus]|uniref:Carboxylesterase patB n=1 Tax=Hyphodiscus hymeniophilus TaxID=353542 RepID=A0A9P7AUN7_9HELO|nr:Carboxylesterase patB [Hyphodiscus hymeniophilus]
MRSSWTVLVVFMASTFALTLPTVDLGYAIHQPTINVCISTTTVAGWFRNRTNSPREANQYCFATEIESVLIYVQETGQYYNFSNIRYAAAPTGKLRFAAPVAPQGRNRTINTGQISSICPQAKPAWLLTEQQFIAGVPLATLLNESSSSAPSLSNLPTPDPSTSDDCLFLDVMVPEKQNVVGTVVLKVVSIPDPKKISSNLT